MIILSIQLAPWDNMPYYVSRARGGLPIEKDDFCVGDSVIIKTETATDLGKVIRIEQASDEDVEKSEVNFILRRANSEDLKKWEEKNKEKKQAIKKCQSLVKKKDLPMKIIDALFSFDGGRITFAFSASSRIDFRKLVKELSQEFHKSIRMHQVGARQGVRVSGNIGPCGRTLCCLSFLSKLGSVTTDMMVDQQLSHRGPERLTGPCGRLKCCLAYEQSAYKELTKNLPPIGSKVKTKQGPGKVIDWHVLKQTVVIKKEDQEGGETTVEVPLKEVKF